MDNPSLVTKFEKELVGFSAKIINSIGNSNRPTAKDEEDTNEKLWESYESEFKLFLYGRDNLSFDVLLILIEKDSERIIVSADLENFFRDDNDDTDKENGLHSTILIMKNNEILNEKVAIENQLNAIMFPSLINTETLMNMIGNGITSVLDLLSIENRSEQYSQHNIEGTKKKLKDVSRDLMNLKNTIDKPDILNLTNTKIKEIIVNHNATVDNYKEFLTNETLDDPKFLNELQSVSNIWIKLCKRLKNYEPSMDFIDTLSEIKDWSNFADGLEQLLEDLNKNEVQISLDILTKANRVQSISQYLDSTGIENQLNRVNDYNRFLSNIPIDKLRNSNNLNEMDDIITDITSALRRFRLSTYPMPRFIKLLNIVSNDLLKQMLLVVPNIFEMDINTFNENYDKIMEILSHWDKTLKENLIQSREVIRRKQLEISLPINFSFITDDIKSKLKDIEELKSRKTVLQTALFQIDMDNANSIIETLFQPFDALINMDIVMGSKWNMAQKSYTNNLFEFETKLLEDFDDSIKKIGDDQLLQTIIRYEPIIAFSPRLKSKIRDQQHILLNLVKKEISMLALHFENQEKASIIFQLREVPALSSSLSDFHQIHTRLDKLLNQVEALLGSNWKETPDGEIVAVQSKKIYEKTNIQKQVDTWSKKLVKTNESLSRMYLFKIVLTEDNLYKLSVNFDFSVASYFMETRYLQYLNEQLPRNLIRQSIIWMNTYNIASHFEELVQTFLHLRKKTEHYIFTSPLINHEIDALWETIKIGLREFWTNSTFVDSSNVPLTAYLRKFDISIMQLMNNIDQISDLEDNIRSEFDKYKCTDDISALPLMIKNIQSLLENLPSSNAMNVHPLYTHLNKMVLNASLERCSNILSSFKISTQQVTIRFVDNLIFAEPSISDIKTIWIQEIEDLLLSTSNVHLLNDTSSSVINVGGIGLLASSLSEKLDEAYSKINCVINQGYEYIMKWKSKEALWDISEYDLEKNKNIELNNITMNLKKLVDSKSSTELLMRRSTLHSALNFDSKEAYTFITAKQKYWISYMLDIVIPLYIEDAVHFNDLMITQRRQLESVSLSFINIENIRKILKSFRDAKVKRDTWDKHCQILCDTESLIIKSDANLPAGFIFWEQLESEVSMIDQCLEKYLTEFQTNKETVFEILNSEKDRIDKESENLIETWGKTKQSFVNLSSSEILSCVRNIKTSFHLLEESIMNAKECATLVYFPTHFNYDLSDSLKEIQTYELSWSDIDVINTNLYHILNSTWKFVDLLETAHTYKKLSEDMDHLPLFVKSTTHFKKSSATLKAFTAAENILKNLKDPSMKARHWKSLFTNYSINKIEQKTIDSFAFTLQDILDLDLVSNESLITKVVEIAQREYIIEKSVRKIQDFWKDAHLIFIEHESGQLIVEDWDVIQQACKDDLDELNSMKSSYYYSNFENVCLTIEAKLIEFSEIVSCWIDVQFYWLDMFGILGNNKQMKSVLPLETSKFNYISSQFRDLTKRASTINEVINITTIPNFQTSFNKILSSLKLIRTSLNEFLEKYREYFPRFYFIGNEDLLKIIGSTNVISTISKYTKNLFGNIDHVVGDSSHISAVVSMEGEKLQLKNIVEISHSEAAYEWLLKLDLEIKHTVATHIISCIQQTKDNVNLLELLDKYTFQALLVSFQILMTTKIEGTFKTENLNIVKKELNEYAIGLNKRILAGVSPLQLRKIKGLIVELIRFEDILHNLASSHDKKETLLKWKTTQKFYFNDNNADILKQITVSQNSYYINYSYEYIGVPERLIYNKLLENGFAAMTDAKVQGLGGCLFGPAGTGKTETIKALGQNLGKMVVIFNCDESFDFSVTSRLLLGISKIGCWGCFDEFNRLDENVLSASASSLELIQNALSNSISAVNIAGKDINLHSDTAIFITLNPDYAGRSELPENLRKKFRSFYFKQPEEATIIKGILATMLFPTDDEFVDNIIKFMNSLKRDCKKERHYDFGLRLLKRVLHNCSNVVDQDRNTFVVSLLKSLSEIVLPMLSKSDSDIYLSVEKTIFPEQDIVENMPLTNSIELHCRKNHNNPTQEFVKKCHQIYEMQKKQQAIILLGNAGCGKSTVLETTLKAIEMEHKKRNDIYKIDTKALTKEELYGTLNKTTLEWKDGIFTNIIRNSTQDSVAVESIADVWIIFDSDIDPIYTETINSVLDDNKILTLPNGERLAVSDNIHLVFETTSIKFTTPATITRCGLIWFSDELFCSYDQLLKNVSQKLQKSEKYHYYTSGFIEESVRHISQLVTVDTWSTLCFERNKIEKIMGNKLVGYIEAIATGISDFIVEFNDTLQNLQLSQKQDIIGIALKQIFATFFLADCNQKDLNIFISFISKFFKPDIKIDNPRKILFTKSGSELITLPISVPQMRLDPENILRSDIVIPTADTLIQQNIIRKLLETNTPVLLCGPPGVGKTMLVNNTLEALENYDLVGMNFSKETTVDDILTTIQRLSVYVTNSNSYILQPKLDKHHLVLFCDEVNLPKLDEYQSQPVILFLRQLIEKNGFWRSFDNKWVELERIHLIAACNPPDYPGRVELTPTFTRHMTVINFDYPSNESLERIYGTYFDSIFSLIPQLKSYASDFTKASLHLYNECKSTFSTTKYPHYILTPRELTRWVKGVYYAISNGPRPHIPSIVRVWMYESLRIFFDKLVEDEDKLKFQDILNNSVKEYFPGQYDESLILNDLYFCNWFNLEYTQVSKNELSQYIKQRYAVFIEEEAEGDMVIYDEMLDHILRIDRIFRQHQGHGMLVGPSRTGKTTITRFVAWMNGFEIAQPRIHNGFSLSDFDTFLRNILLNCTIEEKQICLLINESDMLETSFLERMNTLLANADIPDLFQGDDFENLMSLLNKKADSLGLILETNDDKYKWFTGMVGKNLHIIFTVSDPYESKKLASPALFNRCIINWMGEWDTSIMLQVGLSTIESVPVNFLNYKFPENSNHCILNKKWSTFNDVILNVFIYFDQQFHHLNNITEKSPCYFIDAIHGFQMIFYESFEGLEKRQRFVVHGLDKLNESVLKVKEMNRILAQKKKELSKKETEARKTLDELLVQQNESERKQEATEEIKNMLLVQEKEKQSRYQQIERDLQEIEPAIVEAQQGVKNIKKQQLTEIRSMNNPPKSVQTALEAVCLILGYKFSSWRDIQSYIRNDSFLYDIVHYDVNIMMNVSIREIIEDHYFSRDNFNYETINRASKACGPLYQWVYTQVRYAQILHEINPMQEEARVVEDQLLRAKARLLAAEEMVEDLKQDVEDSKNKYSSLIRDVELIKTDMESVQQKLERSMMLVDNLTSEKNRWIESIESFTSEGNQIVGNSVITAIYSSYCSILDEKQRYNHLQLILEIVQACNIDHNLHYNFSADNINISKRTDWISCGLPNNEFYLENFDILMNPKMNVPYFIDSTQIIVGVLSNIFKSKLVTISFLEHGFLKRLENAVKFGNAVLLQDGEFFDPIIINLVAKQYKNVGSRQVVSIGDNDIDVSPDFRLFIHSSNGAAHIESYVKARVKYINFSINKGNIEMQAVRIALQKEKPLLQQEKDEVLKVNSEYKIRLISLEENLLQELSESSGNMLENNQLIDTLEKIKKESAEIEGKLSESEYSIRKYSQLTEEYSILGQHCVMLYSIIEEISKTHWFYGLPVWQFMECFNLIFSDNDATGIEISCLVRLLYQKVYEFFSINFDSTSKKLFALLLFISYKTYRESISFKNDMLTILEVMGEENSSSNADDIIERLRKNDNDEILQIIEFLEDGAFNNIFELYQKSLGNSMSLENVITQHRSVSILMANEQHMDGSFEFNSIASKNGKRLTVIPLGSNENNSRAEREISNAANSDNWILLQNVQYSLKWVEDYLTKELENNTSNNGKNSRKVFMTCKLAGNELPFSLLQQSYRYVYEAVPNVLQVVKKFWFDTSFTPTILKREDEFSRYRYLITWVHAIMVVRSSLSPYGFNKRYDFNDCDYKSCLLHVDYLLDNTDDEKLILPMLKYYLETIIYGGKMDNDEDITVLRQICNTVLVVDKDKASNESDDRASKEIPTVANILEDICLTDDISKYDNKMALDSRINTIKEPEDMLTKWLGITQSNIKLYERQHSRSIVRDALEIYKRVNISEVQAI